MEQLELATVNHYVTALGVSITTAKQWRQQDLEQLNRRVLTVAQFDLIHRTLEPLPVEPQYRRNGGLKVQNGAKRCNKVRSQEIAPF